VELPEEWKESIVVPIYKKGDKRECSNYRGISLLPATYKILSNILLSRLTRYAEEIIGDHQCGFRHNRSTQLLIIYIAFLKNSEGALLNKLNILASVESAFRYFCMSRLVPLLSS